MDETNKINTENPKTKTDYEMRDFSSQNIMGWAIIIGIVYLASRLSKKTNK
jgi:hypothetical protein